MIENLSRATLYVSVGAFGYGFVTAITSPKEVSNLVWCCFWLAVSAVLGTWTVVLMILGMQQRARLAKRIDEAFREKEDEK